MLPAPLTAAQLEMTRCSWHARLRHAASSLPGLFVSVVTCAVMAMSVIAWNGQLLDRLPDGEAFRQAVIAQGRLFTVEEFKVVEKTSAAHAKWYERAIREKQRLASCQRLYGVAADGSLDEENR